MTEVNDESLMEQVMQGNLQHASILFENYNKKLFSFFVRLTYDKELSNDLTQNVFLRMLKYRKSYKQGSKFRPWIYQIARNVLTDHFRKDNKWNSDYEDLEQAGKISFDDNYDEQQKEQERILHWSLSRLPEDQREVLVLSRFQNMKYEEIAQVTNTTVANIKIKVHRAMKKLRTTYFELEKQME